MEESDGRFPHGNRPAESAGDTVSVTQQSTRPQEGVDAEARQTMRMPEAPASASGGAVWSGAEPGAGAGETTVADGVVAQVAATAARAVSGVHGLVPRSGGDPLIRLFRRIAGSDRTEIPGVIVKSGPRDVVITLTMTVDYGASIPQVVDAVRASVTHNIQSLTGLTVREVTIEVVSLHLPDGGDQVGR